MPETPARRVALVTGCGKKGGIGNAIAMALAHDGAALVVADVARAGIRNAYESQDNIDTSWSGLDDLVQAIRAGGGEAVGLLGDVSDESDANRMVSETIEAFGRLDILVNNAAAPQGADYADIADVPVDAWNTVMNVNARGTFLMCRAAVPQMRTQGWGRIINIASIAGKRGMRKLSVYCASKAAVIGMTRSIALDVADSGITVNAVCPGHVRTSRTRSEIPSERIADVIPVGRYGDVSDIAASVAFLASDAASFITAAALHVDGGELPV